jgi:hypothetical protein
MPLAPLGNRLVRMGPDPKLGNAHFGRQALHTEPGARMIFDIEPASGAWAVTYRVSEHDCMNFENICRG